MEESGLWRLFFATGLPQAYLALRGLEEEREQLAEQPAMTAFGADREPKGAV